MYTQLLQNGTPNLRAVLGAESITLVEEKALNKQGLEAKCKKEREANRVL